MENTSLNEKTKKFVAEVTAYSGGKIQNEEDLFRIVKMIYRSGNDNKLEELCFSAKYIQGLLRIIRKTDREFEKDYFEKVKKEYTQNVITIKKHLEDILEFGSEFIQEIFKEKYLEMTQASLKNLNLLIEDLSWVKLYLNYKKRHV